MIRAVVFDVGECPVDETREYGAWADWLSTFHAMFGAVIAQGRDYRERFREFRPGFDLHEEREKRAAAGQAETFGEDDLYEDVRPTLTSLRADGLWLGIAGNQTVRAGRILRSLFSDDVDLVGTSDDWGASKPEPEFFKRVTTGVPFESDEILYLGDRCDNDIFPAAEAGMHTALVHRGPWATIQWNTSEARELPTFRVHSLLELSGFIIDFNASTRWRWPTIRKGNRRCVPPARRVA
ncbi:HAD family hydrolase [Streptomyces sp. NPDC005122]